MITWVLAFAAVAAYYLFEPFYLWLRHRAPKSAQFLAQAENVLEFFFFAFLVAGALRALGF